MENLYRKKRNAGGNIFYSGLIKTNIHNNAGLTLSHGRNICISRAFASIAGVISFLCVIFLPVKLFGQAPSLSYPGPQVYTAGTSITPIFPTNTGGTVSTPGTYNNPQTLVTASSGEVLSGVAADSFGDVYYGTGISSGTYGYPATVNVKLPGDTTQYYYTSTYSVASSMSLGIDPNNNLYMNANGLSEQPAGANPDSASLPLCYQTYSTNGVCGSAAGFIYVAEGSKHLITEFVRGVLNQKPVTFSSALSDPVGVAVDAAGNVYAVDNTLSYVTEFKTDGTIVHLGTGLSSPWGIAVDANGNIFVADTNNGVIKEYPAGGSAFVTIGPGKVNALASPKDVAVDRADNLYIIDWGANNSPRTLKYVQRFTGYTISPALPQGLYFDPTSGEISGTPTQTMAATTYTISANNSSGTGSTTLIITVNPHAPMFSYKTPDLFFKGVAITPLTPTSGNEVGAPGYNSSAASTTLLASGFNQPIGVAADAAGNVYVADPGNSAIYKIPAGGGSTLTLGSGFNGPYGVAVDAAGNVYVADTYNNAIKKIPVGGGAPVTIATGFSYPTGVAVDAAGNVYVADYGNNAVKEIPAGGGAVITLALGFSNPEGVAVDAAGNVYVADTGNNEVKEITAGGGNIVFIGSGYNTPTSVASDAAGNLYVADSYNSAVKYIAVGGAPVVIGSGLYEPFGVAVNGSGKVYVSDDLIGQVYQITPAGGFFISPALPAGLSFNSTTGVISGTPTATQTATSYLISGYNVSGQDTATISIAVAIRPIVTYQSPQTYYLGTAITPLTPTSANVAPQGYSSTTVDMNLGVRFPTYPTYLAFDAAGDLYVAEGGENYVTEIYRGGGTPYQINTGFQNPTAMYVDPKNFIYLCNGTGNSIVRVGPNGGAAVTLYTGLNNPEGIITDVNGNIYESDYGSNTVNRFPAAGGTPVAYGTGFSHPKGLAFDAAGNLYVVDAGNNALKEVLASNGTTITLMTGLNAPTAVAIDATGNIFISDTGNKVIRELPAGSTTPITIGPSLSVPLGVVVDQAGNVDVASLLHYAVYQIQPTGGYYLNIPLPAGLKLNNATGTISGTPTVVSAAFNYTITAYGNGYGEPVNVNIQVSAATANATLSALKLSSGSLTPTFATGTTSYTSGVGNGATSITVTPTTADPAATVTVNGTATTSGTASAAIALNVGSNAITITVTAQDGVTKQTYTVVVTEAKSANANLASFKPNTGTLSPTFTASTTSYTESVNYAVSSMTITPTTADPTATVTVNGTAVTSGAASAPINLAVGTNIITTIVTAQNGTTKTYTLTVTRGAAATVASLSNLTISSGTLAPAFVNTTTAYTASVPNATTSITVTPTASSLYATITVNGTAVTSGTASAPVNLNVGSNTINTVVTAQNGTTVKTYTITVTRAAGGNDNLSNLTISNGTLTPVFAATTTSYTAAVGNGLASMTITPTTADPAATVTVNGTAVTSGSPSQSLPLAVGPNTITTTVTAQDGVTKQTYTVLVTEAKSSNANLTAFKPGTGSLTPIFAAATISYTENVPNTISTMTITPTTAVNSATVTINGTAVASGTASTPIALSVGSNTITGIVTAQNGAAKTYTLTVTRAAGGVDGYDPGISVTKPTETPTLNNDGIVVHQAVSPNGDGINDFLQIDNISNYPDNRLMIMNRNGQLIYEASHYDNSSKVFDGHSNKNGQMQLPGTYFYQLDYTMNGITKHKTGFLVLKY